MRNKIAYRLIAYFSITLLLFSIIIGSVFMMLFKAHTVDLQKSELESRAIAMADTLSGLIGETHFSPGSRTGMAGGGQGGYMAYLRFLDDIAGADVWIVDENLELITIGPMSNQSFNYADLPKDADTVVKEVFQGNTTFSEGFSDLLKSPTLTVGIPIQKDGKVVGALLLHSPVKGIDDAVGQGFGILTVSVFIALALSIILSVILAISFTKPLKKMKSSAVQLAGGDYSVKTGVDAKDEIGELASAIDILSERLALASRESEKLAQLRRDFVANISHELRTPVTVIRGSLEALHDGVVTDPDQIKDYYLQMLNESVFLQRLVDDLLELSRLQNVDFKIEMRDLSLCDVLNDVIRSARNAASGKHIAIQYEHQSSSLCNITGDYGRIRQMIMIIIDNAVKFSPEFSVVSVSLKDRVVSIYDQGAGIPQEDLPHIFERFYKSKSEQNKNGTGLGLAIAKQIAERHGIQISVTSSPSGGTEFLLHF
ncbi:sensor histidine kinase [Sinanaerobacter chloroacetimidivorans]|uniref:histidine kinase n=1 Tax=Sinanaerobacter chloroacetimidivorans TaxID=2818044 RepID=A0A8J7W0C7_9FIRM|nr:ATP-binding protein [Sinanaerobacter chloroacetimidivorans]MBR0598482.1 HAMP domain-containing protein [Sinanaerobacter chloroacetimidivorans]